MKEATTEDTELRATTLPEVHGLGRHRSAVDDVQRHPEGFTARAIPWLDDVERRRRAALRADQRQPYRLRQAREHRCHGNAARGHREDQG